MPKGQDTRSAILRQALDLSSQVGLEGLTIGVLAQRAGMSKSGLYAHFDSKEALQSQVLQTAADLFRKSVFEPAIKMPRGLPRVEALFERWLDWSAESLSGGCPFIAAATEFDDRPGFVRDQLVAHLERVTALISRAAEIAVEEGHFREDLDVKQFAFDSWGVLLSFQHAARLMRADDSRARASRSFQRILKDAQPKA